MTQRADPNCLTWTRFPVGRPSPILGDSDVGGTRAGAHRSRSSPSRRQVECVVNHGLPGRCCVGQIRNCDSSIPGRSVAVVRNASPSPGTTAPQLLSNLAHRVLSRQRPNWVRAVLAGHDLRDASQQTRAVQPRDRTESLEQPMLELDHIFCMVAAHDDWAHRLASSGWPLQQGTAHPGQGTRNRRLPLGGQYLELAWVEDRGTAANNMLALHRRADWSDTGASPFGFGFRGHLPRAQRSGFWLYDSLGFPIWIHRTNDTNPERPLVFVLELTDQDLTFRRQPSPRRLTAVRHTGPAPAAVPSFTGPPIEYTPGPHHVELVTGPGRLTVVNELLSLLG
jgi:hypothetical protein